MSLSSLNTKNNESPSNECQRKELWWLTNHKDECSADGFLYRIGDLHTQFQTDRIHPAAEQSIQEAEDGEEGVLAWHQVYLTSQG